MKNMNRAFLASMVGLLAAAGCNQGILTEDERAQLSSMTLGKVPDSPSNTYADNVEAVSLGQMFFFDQRFSGPLMESSDVLGPAGTTGKVACATCHNPASGGAAS